MGALRKQRSIPRVRRSSRLDRMEMLERVRRGETDRSRVNPRRSSAFHGVGWHDDERPVFSSDARPGDPKFFYQPVPRMTARNISKVVPLSIVFALPATVFAHEAGPANFDELGSWWAFEPGVVIPLVLSLLLYVRGLVMLRTVSPHAFGRYELACFLTGWLVLVIA